MSRLGVPILFSLALFVFSSCERVDLDKENESTSKADKVIPIGHGHGTQEFPYTVADLLRGQVSQSLAGCWVMGYAVGSTYSSFDNAMFSVPTSYHTNLLLADDSLCTDVTQCIAVELKSSAIQKVFSLYHYPEGYRKFVVLCGVYGQYFKHVGLRQISQGYWFPEFDASGLSPEPIEWDEVDSKY